MIMHIELYQEDTIIGAGEDGLNAYITHGIEEDETVLIYEYLPEDDMR